MATDYCFQLSLLSFFSTYEKLVVLTNFFVALHYCNGH